MQKTIEPDELRKLGESQTVEFKLSLRLQKEGYESLCAFINADPGEGEVWFGVSNDGVPKGVEPGDLDRAQQTLSQRLKKFDPQPTATIDVIECDGHPLVRVHSKRIAPLHEYDRRAWIREGTVNRRLSVAEKDALRKRRNRASHNGPWQCDRCGSWVGLLVAPIITPQGVAGTNYACGCGGELWPA